MSAKANKRKSLIAQNGPPSKSPKVKSNNTPAKPPPKQVLATQPKRVAQGKGQGGKGKKVITPAPHDSESENEDEDDSDFEFDDELSGDSENDAEGAENEQDSDGDESSDDDEDSEDDKNNEDEDESAKKSNEQDKRGGNQKRYVVYVGNIPYKSTVNDIRAHFKDVGPVKDVRIITHKDGKAKGFCFVEFKDSKTYEKSLSLNNSLLGERRISVEYSANSKDEKKVKEAKKKNFKLQALQKQGKLEGGLKENQKRRNRRLKAKQAEKQENDSD
ncbi:hypothetical protein FQR65_LT07816 [Abscondita terminalis]|nr:hypothetical protein FQR65_LT07816 [Abscondita terminalis]